MKLIRFGNIGEENPGLLLENNVRIDASDFGADWDENFFASNGLDQLKKWLQENRDKAPKIKDSTRWASAIARPSKIICVGLNFKDHAEEGGMEVPREPILFFKSTSSFSGPFDHVVIPKGAKKVDWEVELAVVIKKKATYVSKEEALDFVAGYALHNDYSERAFQLEHGSQWCKGKGCDTFAPFGPFMATVDEIPDVDNLSMWLKVNGEEKQNGTTKNFIFDIPTVISYISEYMTLLPGDIISTGTPAGVGLGFRPPHYLKAGDIVELGIEYLGSSKQTLVHL